MIRSVGAVSGKGNVCAIFTKARLEDKDFFTCGRVGCLKPGGDLRVVGKAAIPHEEIVNLPRDLRRDKHRSEYRRFPAA